MHLRQLTSMHAYGAELPRWNTFRIFPVSLRHVNCERLRRTTALASTRVYIVICPTASGAATNVLCHKHSIPGLEKIELNYLHNRTITTCLQSFLCVQGSFLYTVAKGQDCHPYITYYNGIAYTTLPIRDDGKNRISSINSMASTSINPFHRWERWTV